MKFNIDRKYLLWGLTAFLVIIASLFVSFIFFNFSAFSKGISQIASVLTPVANGFLIAYLLSPMADFFEFNFIPLIFKSLKLKSNKKGKKTIRYISVFLSVFCLLLVIYAFFQLLVPQLVESIKIIINSFPDYLNNLRIFMEDTFKNRLDLENLINTYSDNIEEWIDENFMPQMNNTLSKVSSGIFIGISSGIYFVRNLVLGLILSIYILASRELFIGQFRKILFAILNNKTAKNMIGELHFVHITFQNYIVSSIVDSTIIGIICFALSLLIGIPFPTLISVIVGITNIIPFFGPFLGAIPSALIILLAEPIKSLYFLIMIIVLQQFDGNFIKPKLFGS